MISVECMGHQYEIAEPKGAAALELYSLAMAAIEAKGAGDSLSSLAGINDKAQQNAVAAQMARRIGASPDGRAAMYATLLGGKLDGAPITKAVIESEFSKPGRFVEPYAACCGAWMQMGFFYDVSALRPGPSVDDEGADPSGAS